eukprot:6208304-Pleurochrysis_carterae.AAC.4
MVAMRLDSHVPLWQQLFLTDFTFLRLTPAEVLVPPYLHILSRILCSYRRSPSSCQSKFYWRLSSAINFTMARQNRSLCTSEFPLRHNCLCAVLGLSESPDMGGQTVNRS